MTPAVADRPAVSHSREEGSTETSVISKDGAAPEPSLFQSLMSDDSNDSAQLTDVDVTEAHIETEQAEVLPSEELPSLDSDIDVTEVNPEVGLLQPTAVTAEPVVTDMPKTVAGERSVQPPEVPKVPVAAVINIDGTQEKTLQSPPVMTGAGNLSNLPDRESMSPQKPGTQPPVSAVVDNPKTNVQLPVNTGKEVVAGRVDQNLVKDSSLKNPLIETAKASPVSSPVTLSDGETDSLPQHPMPILKDESKPVIPKDTAELMNAAVDKKSNEISRSRISQAILDNMPTVEYRNTNQTSLAMVQPLTEIATPPVGIAVVTDANQSVRADAGLTAQQSLPRLQSNFVSDAATHIKMMVSHGIGRAAVQLNPADLGAMHINIDLKADQLTVQISVAQSATREVMEAALPRLREQLEAEGYTGITIDLDNEGLSEQQHDRNANKNSGFGHSSTVAATETPDTADTPGTSATSIKNNLIDLFA